MPDARIEALKRWARAHNLRRRHALLGGVTVLLLALLVYVTRPGVQRDFALAKLGPQVDSLAIEFIQITPWSAELRGVDVGVGGGRYHIGALTVGFNPFAALAHTISLRHLALLDTVLDVRDMPPGAPASTPFPGVLAAMNVGYALKLDSLDARLSVLLKNEQQLGLTLHGSGFAPLRVGNLKLESEVRLGAEAPPLAVSGEFAITQLNRGRVRLLDAKLSTDLPLPPAAEPQHLDVMLEVEPPSEYLDKRHEPRRVSAPDGTETVIPDPESHALRVRLGNDTPARFEVAGRYHGEDGVFRGHYRIADIAELLGALTAGAPLPELVTDTHGQLELDSLHLRGTLALESRTRVKALQRVLGETAALPAHLDLALASHGSFDANAFNLAALELNVTDNNSINRLSAALGAPLSLPFAAPLSVLETPREIARMALGPLPLAWLQGLAPGKVLNGELLGPFALAIDEQKRIRLAPLAPSDLSKLRIASVESAPPPEDGETPSPPQATGETVLVENLDLRVSPSASWSPDFLRFALNDASVMVAEQKLAEFSIKAASKHSEDAEPTWRFRTQAALHYDAVANVPAAQERIKDYPLPAGTRLAWKGILAQHGKALSIENAALEVSGADRPKLVELDGLRPFHFTLGDSVALSNPQGDLATLATRGIDLAWLNPMLQGMTLSGRIANADFKLVAPSAGSVTLSPAAPLSIEHLSVTRDGQALLRDVAIKTSADVQYSATDTRAALRNLSIRSGGGSLVNGELTVAVHNEAGKPPRIAANGRLAVDVGRVAAQPLVAAALSEPLPPVALKAALDFDVGMQADTIAVRRSRAELKVGERATATLEATPGLVLKSHLAAGEDLAQHFVGAAALDIKDLSSETLNHFVPLGPVSFAEINSSLRIRSDGSILRASTLAPLGIDAIRVNDGPRELLREFSVTSEASVRVEGHEIHTNLEKLALTFAAQPSVPALTGHILADIDPDKTVPLTSLGAELGADLPQLLSQPAVMPGHKLKSGKLAFKVDVDPARKISAKAVLDNLASDEPLAIQTFELPVSGEVAEDGRGFSFTAPLVGRGKSGISNATVAAHYAPQPDEIRVLNLDIASELFYLNDILATAQAIKSGSVSLPATPEAKAAPAKPAKLAMNETPDAKAVWKVVPPAVVVNLQIDKLFYTDYLAFTDVGGQVDLRSRKLGLHGIKAHFHDSALSFEGTTRFNKDAAQPYDLDIVGDIKDFNLNQFFTELVPGEKPRVEGLFGVDVKAFGQFPNFSQLRNKVLFDVTMQSRDGLFRPLPPGSGLMLGASDVLGFVGEGLSYVPTGGFGAGAIARLVNYIAQIDYDTIDIHLKRDESRNVTIEQFQVLSPTIALTATGGIAHEDGSDLFDAPLELNAHLDMLGRGAAILYSMDLMQDTRNELGYWRGPEFRIWGSAAAPESNFEDVINHAADGTTKGAFLRPISGLIGNLKYRWFDSDSRRREALQHERRDNRLEKVVGTTPAVEPAAQEKQAAPAP
ncbi:MAG: hypothetical protein IT492_15985 [Gammaproteobacteria bacterium]|nr:hypothetical protein [Gammaproteobacteria bacterium]